MRSLILPYETDLRKERNPGGDGGSSCRNIHSVFIGQVLVPSSLLGAKGMLKKKKYSPSHTTKATTESFVGQRLSPFTVKCEQAR